MGKIAGCKACGSVSSIRIEEKMGSYRKFRFDKLSLDSRLKSLRTWIFTFVACAILFGCAATQLLYEAMTGGQEQGWTPVTAPTQRLEFPGFSILPPRGDNWFIAPSMSLAPNVTYVAAFAKQTRERTYTIRAAVLTVDMKDERFGSPTEFLRVVERAIEEEMKTSPRHRLLASRVSLESSLGSNCVVYDQTVEDSGVPQFPGSIFILTMHGFRCAHPHWPRYVIDVGYSQRVPRGDQTLSVEAEVEPFLKSLMFTPSRPLFVETIPLGQLPQGVAVGGGSIWAVIQEASSVSRIDPATSKAIVTVPVGRHPISVEFGQDAVWVTNGGDASVSRIDPRTNKVVATIAVGKGPVFIAVGAEAVWVTNTDGTVSRIDPTSNHVAATSRLGKAPRGIAVGGGAVWLADGGDVVLRLDPKTNQVVATIPVAKGPRSVVAGEGAIWVASQGEATVSRINPETNRVVAKIALSGRPSNVTVGGGAVWVTNYDENTVLKIDPHTNQIVGRPIPVGRKPVGVTIGEGSVWVSNVGDGTLSRFSH